MRWSIPLLFVLTAAGLVWAGPKGKVVDDENPRAPGTPLEVVWKPYYCPTCVAEERIPAETQKVTMMRMPVEELAKRIDLAKGWIVITTDRYKILSTLGRSTIKLKDSPYQRADLLRLKEIFPKLVIGREGARLNPHQRAHLYQIRVHRVYSHFVALVEAKEKWLGMHAPYELYLLDDYTEHHTLVDQFIGRSNDKAGVGDHRKEEPNYMMFTSSEAQVVRNDGKGDKIFSNHVVHNVAHNLIDGHGNYYRETWAWLEEGLAHYYERRENPKHNNFCWTEGKKPADFLKPDWESTIYNLVRRGKDTPFNQWCEKLIPGELTAVEQGMCWSFVEWMIRKEPVRFTKMVRKLDDYKNKPNCEQCLDFAFGVSPSVLHQRWREYVLENYKKKR